MTSQEISSIKTAGVIHWSSVKEYLINSAIIFLQKRDAIDSTKF